MGGKDGLLRLINLANLSGQGGPGHTGGEVAGLGINVGPVVLSQPAVWVNPADSSTWLFLANGNGTSAFRVNIAGNGNPSLVSQWSGANGGNSSPLVANNVLYVANGSALRALDPVTKATLWTSAAGAIGSIKWQSPIVANCAVYIADQSARLSAFTLPVNLSSLPMKVAPISVNGGANPVQNTGFDVVVQSLDCSSTPQSVAVDTVVSLSVAAGTGALGGTQGCTILAGDNACTVSGMTYSVVEQGVILAAIRASGDDLGSAISAPFNVVGNGTTPILQGTAARKAHAGSGALNLPLAP
jgi:hypothetical protein